MIVSFPLISCYLHGLFLWWHVLSVCVIVSCHYHSYCNVSDEYLSSSPQRRHNVSLHTLTQGAQLFLFSTHKDEYRLASRLCENFFCRRNGTTRRKLCPVLDADCIHIQVWNGGICKESIEALDKIKFWFQAKNENVLGAPPDCFHFLSKANSRVNWWIVLALYANINRDLAACHVSSFTFYSQSSICAAYEPEALAARRVIHVLNRKELSRA